MGRGGGLFFGKGVLAWALVDGKGGYSWWWSRVVTIARSMSMKFLQLCDNFMCMMVIGSTRRGYEVISFVHTLS